MTKKEKEELRLKNYWRSCSIKIGIVLAISTPIFIVTLPRNTSTVVASQYIDPTVIVGEITEDTKETENGLYECCNPEDYKFYESNLYKILNIQENNFHERMKMKVVFKTEKKATSVGNSSADSDELVNAVARVIMCEAGGVSDDYWQQLVGYVLLNRVKSSAFPDTVLGVLKSGYANETIQKYSSIKITDRALKNAQIVVEHYYNNDMPVPSNLVYQAEFPQGETWKQIGNTYFGIAPNLK